MKKPSVLVIDDSVTFLKLIKSILIKEGLRVLIAKDVKKAYNLIVNKLPDLILLDLIFPEAHGFDLLEKIKNDVRYSYMKFIIVSSENNSSVIKKALELGADDYLTKPIIINDLKNKCRI